MKPKNEGPDPDIQARKLDDLLEQIYGNDELAPGETEASAHLEELEQVLKIVDQLPVPERAEDYGAQVWQRLAPQLPEQAQVEEPDVTLPPSRLRESAATARPVASPADKSRPIPFERPTPKRSTWRYFGQLAAALLLLALGFLVGRENPTPGAQPEAEGQVVEIDGEARERLLQAALGRHLGRTERLLTELSNTQALPASNDGSGNDGVAGPGPESLTERDWAEELLRTNRLYRQAAERSGQARIVSLLNELEPILLELAHTPEASELEELKRRVDEKSLLFKVRVTEGRLAAHRSSTI